jgi:excisionase family DNA binding protein
MVRQRHPAVGRNRIYEAIANGVLTGVKVGKRLAIPVDDVDEWVAAGAPTEPSGGQTRRAL